MAVNLSPVGGVAAQFFTNNGTPLSGGKLFTYAAGTTTPLATYTAASGNTPWTNPIVLDSAGRVPSGGEIWLTDGLQYKFVLKDSNDVLIATYDNITGINSNFVNYTNQQEIQTATAGQTVFTLTTMQYLPGTGSLSVFVDGVNQYGPGAQYAFLETNSTTVTFVNGLHIGASVKFTTTAINAASYGDAFQISYTPPFTGSVPTNVGDKLAETASVQDFGAVGNGIADDTAAIQAAVDGALAVDFGGADNSYKINGTITLRNGQTLIGTGATLTQTASNTELLNIVGKTDIRISGLKFVGVGSDFSDSDASKAVAIYANNNEKRIWVSDNYFYNFSYTPLRLKGSTDVSFVNNVVIGPGAPILTPVTSGRCYGALADTGCYRILFSGNSVSKCAQGFRIEGSQDVRVANNVIHTIVGQHGIYAGASLLNIAVVGNNITSVDLIGIKFQAANTGSHNQNITIVGNTVTTTGDQGILISNGGGGTSQAIKNKQVTITGNTVKDANASGINLQNAVGAVVADNVVESAGASGINLSASDYFTIANNTVLNCELSAIRDESPCTFYAIKNNRIVNCAQASTVGDRYGIFIQDVTYVEIAGNTISDANAKMQYGIYTAGGTQSTLTMVNNTVLSATDAGVRFQNATDPTLAYSGNYFTGTLSTTFNDPALPSVASATTIALSTSQNVFKITGTTNISTITANGHSGHTVTLIFADVLTVSDSASLYLAGNFTTTANDTLTLTSDGVYWYEVARSVN